MTLEAKQSCLGLYYCQKNPLAGQYNSSPFKTEDTVSELYKYNITLHQKFSNDLH